MNSQAEPPARPNKRARCSASGVQGYEYVAASETASSSSLATHGVTRASSTCRGYDRSTNSGRYDATNSYTLTNCPYSGDFAGYAWNAQALFAQKTQRQFPKRFRAQQLMKKHDFGILSETHGLEGRADAWWLPPDTMPFWSHGTSHQGGVGLWVKQSFLSRFPNWVWVELEAGRVAVLRLSGECGELDIFCVYLDTSSSPNRQNSIKRISKAVRPKDKVLSIIAGDFNFVEYAEDRWNLNAGEFSGGNNNNDNDAKVFEEALRDTSGFYEWEQPHFTCEAGGARSRIDRMYTNQHIAYQLDHICNCSVLEWDIDLSRHRAISFSRRSPAPRCQDDRPLNPRAFNRKGWADEVLQSFSEMCVQDTVVPSPNRRLLLLKDAIRVCSLGGEGDGDTENSPPPPEDQLGLTLACIKALEKRNHNRVAQLRQLDDFLAQHIPHQYETRGIASICSVLRDRAVSLSRQIITEDIRELSLHPPDEPDERTRRKENILRKLSRLSPGETSNINAMRDKHGQITTTPAEIAQILREHWKGVFTEKQVELTALQVWMEELFIRDEHGLFLTGLPAIGSGRWIIQRKAITKAIATARDSMPGPDGIPAAAYKRLGQFATDILYEVSVSLCSHDGIAQLASAYSDRCPQEMHDFNKSLLCCLPKKVAGTDPIMGDFYSGDTTRPLALVNTDNRILASAARISWEPLLANYISTHQQGFLKGRQMLNNVIDIDYHAMTISLKCRKGVMMFFDFKAAFPSVSHAFLKRSLQCIGLPPSALSFINALYDNNKCDIAYKGNLYEGFGMYCGVRQGCPISPLLFAAAVDVLLRRLQQKIPSGHIRAFADDIALVAEEWGRDCGVAHTIFKEFAGMSGLELNIPKTVLIPLWPRGVQEASNKLRKSSSDWRHLQVAGVGTYLGFKSGPEKGSSTWDVPITKYNKRIQNWQGVGAGAQFATLAYNTFALSTLLFVAQLEDPPDSALSAEIVGLRTTMGGPGNCFEPNDVYFLKELYGQCKSYNSLSVTAQAAKLRVLHMHNSSCQGTSFAGVANICSMHRRLQDCLERPIETDRLQWAPWYKGAHVSCLHNNEQRLRALGITLEGCLTSIAGSEPSPWSDEVKRKQKRELQKTVSIAVKNINRPDPVSRVRHKLHRWMDRTAARPSDIRSARMLVPGPPARIANKTHRRLMKLPSLTPPRVCSAVFRTIWNGWCTHCRFQQYANPNNKCWLGCGGDAQDRIEHYCRCPIALEVLKNKLRIDLHPSRALSFFVLSTHEQDSDNVLALGALFMYAVYMSYNHYKHGGHTNPLRAAVISKECIGQHIIQGCQGHAELANLVDRRWQSPMLHIE